MIDPVLPSISHLKMFTKKSAHSINIITNNFIALGILFLLYVGCLAFAMHLKQHSFE